MLLLWDRHRGRVYTREDKKLWQELQHELMALEGLADVLLEDGMGPGPNGSPEQAGRR